MRSTCNRIARILVLGVIAVLPATADAVQGVPIIDFTGGSTHRLVGEGAAGWAFRVTSPITVVGFGVFDADPAGLDFTNEAGLWSVDGALVHSTTVTDENSTVVPSTCDRGSWRFTSIPALDLAPGDYVIGAHYTILPGDDFLAGGVVTTISELTYQGSRTGLGATLEMPTIESTPNGGNFGPNLLLVPEPSSAALIACALASLAWRRRRPATALHRGEE